MKLPKKLKLATIFTGAIILTTSLLSVPAVAQYTEAAVAEDKVEAIAVPAGAIGYNLNVIEQIPGKQQCYAEKGSNPTIIDPLWTKFDFTGSCNRSTDSNGYSVRLDGQDTSLDYRLDVVTKGDQLQLVASNNQDGPDLVVGQTNGKPAPGEYVKINLNPGWKFTKKAYQGKTLGHYFLSGDSTAIAAAGDAPETVLSGTGSSKFSDIARDIYKPDIENAVALGFIAGFKDQTFRPTESLTREQLVSMAYGSLETIDSLDLKAPVVPTQPYPDVDSTRWSASKIQWAKENDIVKGYPDGSFKPGNPVTRAELVAVLQNLAKYANTLQGKNAELATNKEPIKFADISNHWGAATISAMSAYCGVASPYKEVGDSFEPDAPAERNYAAAATLRTHDCLTKKAQ
jgi:N-acetylmuramoyl-L-alanine amidase